MRVQSIITLLPLTALACLGPETNDAVDPARVFGDPNIEPATAPHVEDNPLLADKVAQFGKNVAYLGGWANEEKIWYWNVDGPNATFTAFIYQLVDQNNMPIGRRIIDTLPGDAGYSPWWRLMLVRTTAAYNGERIWSREAIDAGIRSGILEPPMETGDVLNCPVVLQTTKIGVGTDTPASPVWGWYRKQRVHWVDFKEPKQVEIGVREMPIFPVYVLQRINEGNPLYEFLTGIDVTGDGDLDDTNNIFGDKPGGEHYSPLWFVSFVRTVPEYVSIDNTLTGTVGLSAEDQMFDASGNLISPLVVPGRVTPMPSFLVNCSIQRVKGEL